MIKKDTLSEVYPWMQPMKIKRVGNHDLPVPQYATNGSTCFDLSVHEYAEIAPGQNKLVGLGWAFEVPIGYVMLIFQRSGLSVDQPGYLGNGVGVIDSDYRGELKANLVNTNRVYGSLRFHPGDRVVQAVLVPVGHVELREVDELTPTTRGEGGHGSTGR